MHADGQEDVVQWRLLVNDLIASVPDLADLFVDRLGESGAYEGVGVSTADLRTTAEQTIAMLLHQLRDPAQRLSAAAQEMATELGRRRARENVRLESLMNAVRLDFAVIWAEMTRRTAAEGTAMLVSRVQPIWEAVDRFSAHVQQAYLDERAEIGRLASDERRRHITMLFERSNITPDELSRIAVTLGGVEPGDTFKVCAAIGASADLVRTRAADVAWVGSTLFGHDQESVLILFWKITEERYRAASSVAERLVATIACGVVDRVVGLADVPRAAKTATQIARLVNPASSRPHSARDVWMHVARQTLNDFDQLPASILARVDALPPADREVLLRTVSRYLTCGSISITARDCYCHRNTVIKRLQRFRELTGLDLSIPHQAALAVVVLAA